MYFYLVEHANKKFLLALPSAKSDWVVYEKRRYMDVKEHEYMDVRLWVNHPIGKERAWQMKQQQQSC